VTTDSAPAEVGADRLGAAVRALADVVVRTGATEDALAAAADQIEAVTAQLAEGPPAHRVHDSPYHPMSLVGGVGASGRSAAAHRANR
jgi:hypothetical protein